MVGKCQEGTEISLHFTKKVPKRERVCIGGCELPSIFFNDESKGSS